jgi:XTP/dITP diphosphohydrolase
MKLIIASNNQGKVGEFKQLLEPLGYEVLSQSEAGIDIVVQETGKTFEENARLKAKAVYDLVGQDDPGVPSKSFAVISDDSGLEVDALGGAPGVDTAHFDIPWLLEKMQNVEKSDRTARFVCCICYIDGLYMRKVRGECDGWIGFEQRGENGFGYDPIFMVGAKQAGFPCRAEVALATRVKNKSFAQLPDDEKNAISHRGKALRKLVEELK